MAGKDFTILTCLILLSSANAISFSDCGSTNGTEIFDVQVSGCEDLDRCELVRGNKTTLDVTFRTDSNADETKMRINGKIFGTYLPFAYNRTNACENSGLSCPLEPGKNYTYHGEVDVKKFYPPIKVVLRFKLTATGPGEPLFCILIPAILV